MGAGFNIFCGEYRNRTGHLLHAMQANEGFPFLSLVTFVLIFNALKIYFSPFQLIFFKIYRICCTYVVPILSLVQHGFCTRPTPLTQNEQRW